MTAYIIRRLLLVIPTLIGIMIINFAVVQIVPGGPVEQMIAQMTGTAVESTARFVCVVGNRGIEVQNGCNGLDLLGLYAGFIIAYPGSMNKRLYFLFGGLFFLFLANVFRIATYVLTNYYFPQYMDVYHEYSSFIIFYPIVLTLWYLWTENSDQQSFLSGAGFSSV